MEIKTLEKIVEKVSKFDCKLLPVVKNQDLTNIQKLVDFGINDLGENRVKELDVHKEFFPDLNYHFIAPLQSRKISDVLSRCTSIHSVSRIKELDIISKYYLNQNIFIQVNVDNDPNKSGLDKKDLAVFIKHAETKGIHPKGLMCIPNIDSDRKLVFSEMQKINEDLKKNFINYPGELSMGMSNDYEVALDYGATIVRIGSKIFL